MTWILLMLLAILVLAVETITAQVLGNFPLHPAPGAPRSFWRLPCYGPSGIGRLDPLMDPGEVSAHVHTFAGGNGLGFNASYETLVHSTCTSCGVIQDKSAYWTPTLDFVYANGTTVMVEQVSFLVYYKAFARTVAFPEGFRMVAGNPYVRNFSGPFPDVGTSSDPPWTLDPREVAKPSQQFWLMQRAIGFNCLHYNILPAEGSLYRHQLPTKEYMDRQCTDGIRLELAFPSCSNGSLDANDHHSHMAYPSLVQEGVCPEGYPVQLPLLFYEVVYNTFAFAGIPGRFVLSYGDPVGTGFHGDFMMGWDSQELLENAFNTCRNESGLVEDCTIFKIQSTEEAKQCHFAVPEALKDDNPTGPRMGLPVDVPIQYGPQQATNYSVPGQQGVPTKILELQSPPRTVLGNLSIHPYGSLAFPSVMSTASGGETLPLNLATSTNSILRTWMALPSPVTYISGVIASEFSKYLTISPRPEPTLSTTPPSPSSQPIATGLNISQSLSMSGSPYSSGSLPACDTSQQHHQAVSVSTAYKTVNNEVVQLFIEDVKLIITTRTTMTITGTTSTLPSTTTFSRTPSAYGSGMPHISLSSESGRTNPQDMRFNTIMWVLDSKTLYSPPPESTSSDRSSSTWR